jgi:hypothetical protein
MRTYYHTTTTTTTIYELQDVDHHHPCKKNPQGQWIPVVA